MSHDIEDDFDDDFVVDDSEEELLEDGKTKPLEKRLKIDAMLEEQRLNKLKKPLKTAMILLNLKMILMS